MSAALQSPAPSSTRVRWRSSGLGGPVAPAHGSACYAEDELAADNFLAASAACGAIGGAVVIEPTSGSCRYPAPHGRRRRRSDRPSRAGGREQGTSGCWRTSTTWRSMRSTSKP
jgi:hypothetical protein